MKDLSLRSPVVLPVSILASSPTPAAGEFPIIYSSTENGFLEWDGFNWRKLGYKVENAFVIRNMYTSEELVAGNLVNFHNNFGECAVRKASNVSFDRQADGFVKTNAIADGGVDVYILGPNFNSPSTPDYVGTLWLGTNGGILTTPPTSGLSQQVGHVLSAGGGMLFMRGTPVFINP